MGSGVRFFLPGDFHQHTLYTDGSFPFQEAMRQNNYYGLTWWANSEHGGERNRDGEGNYWDEYPENPILGDYEESGGHQEMWRWQSLRDYVYPDIELARQLYPDKTIISGLEQNVPGPAGSKTSAPGRMPVPRLPSASKALWATRPPATAVSSSTAAPPGSPTRAFSGRGYRNDISRSSRFSGFESRGSGTHP